MIQRLENLNMEVAEQIFTVFQNSYKVEANLIGTNNFPPLLRSAKDINHSSTLFYGFSKNASLAAVIEFTIEEQLIDIHSLTVHSAYFRKGIANKLITYVLTSFDLPKAIVETAEANIPAINLYKKHGFVEINRWTPAHGIKKIALSFERPLK